MSVTTTSNPTTTQIHRVLDDYNIRFTGASNEAPAGVLQETNPRGQDHVVENPPNWPDDYHDVPHYREVNRHLDMEERPGGRNPIERLFIFTMLHGVWLNAVSLR